MKFLVAILILSCLVCLGAASFEVYDTTEYGLGMMVTVVNQPFMQITTPQFQAMSGYMYLLLYPIITSGYNDPIYLTYNCSVTSSGGQVIQSSPISMPIGPVMKELDFMYQAQDFQYFSMTCLYHLNLPVNTFFNFYTTTLPTIEYAGGKTPVKPLIESTMIRVKYYYAGTGFSPV